MKLKIISGSLKSRIINVPRSKLIRPTTGRVKETLFNLLTNLLDFENIKILDLYAGSGSLGLECISRGAKEIHFVERDFIIHKNLVENIKSLEVENQCSVFKMAAEKFSGRKPECKYDLILADPPFFKDDIYKVVENILTNKYLAEDSFMIIERSIQTKAEDISKFNTEPFKTIGDTRLYKIDYV